MLFAAKSRSFLKVKMNKSADDEFDYQSDFTQFLNEARKNAIQVNSDTVTNEKKQLNWEKRHKKSWKKSLFSWLKNDSKSKSHNQPSITTIPTSKANRAHVSGPICRAIVGVATSRARRTVSGPLTGLFGSTGGPDEGKVPYMCLGELNEEKIQGYGPIYLVT